MSLIKVYSINKIYAISVGDIDIMPLVAYVTPHMPHNIIDGVCHSVDAR
jgi:hypothetical protein